jgi:hypothetical protein
MQVLITALNIHHSNSGIQEGASGTACVRTKLKNNGTTLYQEQRSRKKYI